MNELTQVERMQIRDEYDDPFRLRKYLGCIV